MKGKLFFLFLLLLSIVSCDNVFINGDLDGMWKLEKVTYPDSIAYPQRIYYSFQRHLVMIGEYYDEGLADYTMAEFDYEDDTLVMTKFYKYPGNGEACSADDLRKYHIHGDTVVFVVDRLDAAHLSMHTGECSYQFCKW